MNLLKAQLRELPATAGARPTAEPIEVQFNPTTLRIAISNKTAGGNQPGAQAKQKPGTGEVTVTFDLHFDTSDEGTTAAPVPVTKRTQIVERFVRPRGNLPSEQSPPRVAFKWGGFQVEGVMESANIDLDLFAADGTPLRAKVAVSIKGQDPAYRYEPATLPPAAEAASGGGTQGLPPGTPGTTGGATAPAAVAEALPGESLPQLSARLGLDPGAWRALAGGIADPQSLAAGQEVALPPDATGAGGIGAAAPIAGAAHPVRAGQAIARQGGLRAGLGTAREAARREATQASAAGFGLAPPRAVAAEGGDAGAARPYGAGVPLRARVGATGAAPPVTTDPTAPGWQALPSRAGAGGLRPLGRKAGCGG